MLANEVERSNPPQYVAFRTMERWVVIPVIARIESREGGRLYGYWFSTFTPEGTLREVPADHVVELGNDDDPQKLIDLLRGGRDLPVEFVQRLHVIDWLDRSPRPGLQRRAARGDLAAAARHLEQGLTLDPANLDLIDFAVRIARRLGRLDHSIALAEYLVARDPINAYGYHSGCSGNPWAFCSR